MLKRIIYITDKDYGKEHILRLFERLAKNGVKTEIVEGFTGKAGCQTEAAETLFITDSPACQKIALQQNLPLLLYLHEDNKNSTFLPAAYAIEKIEEIEFESFLQAYQRLVGEPWEILTTKRCKIRETTTKDVDSFYEIYSEPSITKYMENLYEDRAQETAYIENYIKTVYGFYGYGMWTVLTKEDNTVIGRAGLGWRAGFDVPELGFVIAKPYQSQGYACEVCSAILQYGEKELGFTGFQALVMEGNDKSERLCHKLGFQYAEELLLEGKKYRRMIYVKEPLGTILPIE